LVAALQTKEAGNVVAFVLSAARDTDQDEGRKKKIAVTGTQCGQANSLVAKVISTKLLQARRFLWHGNPRT
jgi:hypothetical protein